MKSENLAIEISDFTKKYGGLTAVDNISLDIQAGQIVGFVGKNGAGKSTLLRALTNIIFPTSGSLKIFGMDAVLDAAKIKSRTAYMPSEANYYKGITTRELIKFAVNFRGSKERALQIAAEFELDLDKRIDSLSLGNRRKVAILMLLIEPRDLYILDEPTNGLDPLMQDLFFKYLLKEKEEGRTVFLSSHNLADVEKYCDRVVIIRGGRIEGDIGRASRAAMLEGKLVSYTLAGGGQPVQDLNSGETLNSSKSIEYLYSLDISRSEIYFGKAFAAFGGVFMINLAITIPALLAGAVLDIPSFGAEVLVKISLIMGMIPLFFAATGLFIAGIWGGEASSSVAAGTVMLLYLTDYLGGLLQKSAGFIKSFSPFAVFRSGIVYSAEGTDIALFAVFVGVMLMFIFAGFRTYIKRDFKV